MSIRQIFHVAVAALLPFVGAIVPAHAQGKLEAHYSASLAGLPVGKGNWVVNIGDSTYTAVASGVTTGLMRVLTGGQGTTSARGTLSAGRPVLATYSATIKTSRKTDEVLMTVNEGQVKDIKLSPSVVPDPQRIPVTDAERSGVIDPMTASLLRVPGTGAVVSSDACQRSIAVFDGRLRYNLKLAFKRMDTVTAGRGYTGSVVVCSVSFTPIAGFVPTRYVVKYLAEQREMEVWLAPIAGTRVLVPFRFETPTPVGAVVMEATEFVTGTTAPAAPAAAKGVKTQ